MKTFWKPVVGIAFLCVIAVGPELYGTVTSSSRVDPGVEAAIRENAYIDIAVDLGFVPEKYHIEFFQDQGTFTGADAYTVAVQRVDQNGLTQLARQYWIERIRLLREE